MPRKTTSATAPIGPETVTRTVLANGIVLLVHPNHNNASVVVRGRLEAGSVQDTAATAGLAGFTAAALQRGTAKRTFPQLNAELDSLGASFGVGAGLEAAGFGGRCLVEDLDAWLDIAADVLRQPTFPAEEVEKLRGQILTGLREAANDTQYVANKAFRALAYPRGHPFGRLSDGEPDTVQALTRDDLAACHARFYRPDTLTLAIVGDILPDEALAKVQRAFGDWQAVGDRPTLDIPAPASRLEPVRQNLPVPGKTQADIVLGFPGIKRHDPDFYALLVGDVIFGHLGLMGRLGRTVRDEQGLAYYATSGLEAGQGAGPWAVYAGVNPAHVEQAIASIQAEWARLSTTPVTAQELADAQDFLTGSLALRLETNEGMAGAIMEMEVYGLGLDYLQRYPAIIRRLTAEQILAAVQRHAHLPGYALVVAGPV
ncbi:MAG: insulinase family protein [Chloroflexi bacterium]|nr:insulinase family protein [Chloroflexota bacterium]